MALPVLETPTFTGTIPSTGKKFEFRPFLVKEQKTLLFALETQDIDQIYLAFRDIINACVKPEGSIDISSIPSFDTESIFLQISAKSIGEKSKINVRCSNCNEYNEQDVTVTDNKIKNFKKKANIIQLTDTVGIKMKYSSLKNAVEIIKKEDREYESEKIYETISSSIESVFDEQNVYPVEDYSQQEMEDFLNSLSLQQMKKIEEFFEKTPYLYIDVEFECSHCGHKNKQEIKGINNFF